MIPLQTLSFKLNFDFKYQSVYLHHEKPGAHQKSDSREVYDPVQSEGV